MAPAGDRRTNETPSCGNREDDSTSTRSFLLLRERAAKRPDITTSWRRARKKLDRGERTVRRTFYPMRPPTNRGAAGRFPRARGGKRRRPGRPRSLLNIVQ